MKNLKWIVLLLAVPVISMLFTGCKCEDEELIIPIPPLEVPITVGTETEHITVGELIELTDNQLIAFSDFFEKVIYLDFAYYDIVREQWNAIEEEHFWFLPPQEGSNDLEPYFVLPFEEINLNYVVQEQSLLSMKGHECQLAPTDRCIRMGKSNLYIRPKTQVTLCIEKEGAVCSYIWKETDVTIYEDSRCSKPAFEAKVQLARCIL